MAGDPTIGIIHVPAGDTWLVSLRGEHDLATAGQVAEVLDGLPGNCRVVIDLTETTFIDSTIIGLLLEHLSTRDGADRAVAVVAAGATLPRRVLDMVRLPEMLPVYDTTDEAFAALGVEQPDVDPDPV